MSSVEEEKYQNQTRKWIREAKLKEVKEGKTKIEKIWEEKNQPDYTERGSIAAVRAEAGFPVGHKGATHEAEVYQNRFNFFSEKNSSFGPATLRQNEQKKIDFDPSWTVREYFTVPINYVPPKPISAKKLVWMKGREVRASTRKDFPLPAGKGTEGFETWNLLYNHRHYLFESQKALRQKKDLIEAAQRKLHGLEAKVSHNGYDEKDKGSILQEDEENTAMEEIDDGKENHEKSDDDGDENLERKLQKEIDEDSLQSAAVSLTESVYETNYRREKTKRLRLLHSHFGEENVHVESLAAVFVPWATYYENVVQLKRICPAVKGPAFQRLRKLNSKKTQYAHGNAFNKLDSYFQTEKYATAVEYSRWKDMAQVQQRINRMYGYEKENDNIKNNKNNSSYLQNIDYHNKRNDQKEENPLFQTFEPLPNTARIKEEIIDSTAQYRKDFRHGFEEKNFYGENNKFMPIALQEEVVPRNWKYIQILKRFFFFSDKKPHREDTTGENGSYTSGTIEDTIGATTATTLETEDISLKHLHDQRQELSKVKEKANFGNFTDGFRGTAEDKHFFATTTNKAVPDIGVFNKFERKFNLFAVNKPVTKRQSTKNQRQWEMLLNASKKFFLGYGRSSRDIHKKNISLITGEHLKKSNDVPKYLEISRKIVDLDAKLKTKGLKYFRRLKLQRQIAAEGEQAKSTAVVGGRAEGILSSIDSDKNKNSNASNDKNLEVETNDEDEDTVGVSLDSFDEDFSGKGDLVTKFQFMNVLTNVLNFQNLKKRGQTIEKWINPLAYGRDPDYEPQTKYAKNRNFINEYYLRKQNDERLLIRRKVGTKNKLGYVIEPEYTSTTFANSCADGDIEYVRIIIYGIDTGQTTDFTVASARDSEGRTAIHACILRMLELDNIRSDYTRIKEKHFQKPKTKKKKSLLNTEEVVDDREIWNNGLLNEEELERINKEENKIQQKLSSLDEVFTTLLENGANINLLEQGQPLFECKAPLHYVIEAKNLYRLEYILKKTKGLDINYSVSTSLTGHTPLIRAAALGSTEIVGTLISYGINLKVPDHNGWTPLHHAAGTGSLDVVRALVIAGASRATLTEKPMGQTAADIAKERDRLEIFYFLKSYFDSHEARPGRLLDHLIERYEIEVPNMTEQRQQLQLLDRKKKTYTKKTKKKKIKASP